MVTQIKKITRRGLHNVLTQKLNSDFSGYTDDAAKWTGDTEIEFTPSRQVDNLASGDDPAWDVIKGPVTGTIKIKFHDIAIDCMEHLLSVTYDAVNGICVGDNEDADCFIGISFDETIKYNGTVSNNKTILYKVLFDLPTITSKTVAEGDNALSEVELNGKAYPVFFNKANGTTGRRTYSIVNSKLNANKYEANKDCIVFPSDSAATTSST
jgi:hypothetical protein